MMSQDLYAFFDNFGKIINESNFKKETPNEKIIIAIVEDWQENTKAGHGMFFDFSQTPEIQKPILDYLTKGFGWKQETTFFIRKPL